MQTGKKQGLLEGHCTDRGQARIQNGQLVEEGRYTNSKRIGVWRRYWPNGKVMSEITYQIGTAAWGVQARSTRTERSRRPVHWDLDRNTGKFQRWHPNGKLAQDFVFNEHGVRDGEQKYYHENGQLAVQVQVEEGQGGRHVETLHRPMANCSRSRSSTMA